MSRVWLDEDERNNAILRDDHRRNLKIVMSTHPTDLITHPIRTIKFIKHHSPDPRTGHATQHPH